MKKAQAAMEFLLTYGFAILAFVVAIAALAHFGILTTKEQARWCQFPAGMDCIDSAITKDGATVVLKNNLPWAIVISDIDVGSCIPTLKQIALGPISPFGSFPVSVGKGAIFKLNYACTYEQNKKIKENIIINYSNLDSGIFHKTRGELIDYVI